jgi:AmpE protein
LGLPPANEAVTRDLTAEAVDDAHALLRRALYIWLAALAAGVLLGAL